MDIPHIGAKTSNLQNIPTDTNMAKKRSKKLLKPIIAILVCVVLFYFFILKPILNIKVKGLEVKASAVDLKQAFSQNDIDLINARLKVFKNKYEGFEKDAKSIYWTSYIPWLGGYGKDFKNTVEAGHYFIESAQLAVDGIAPYADLIGFKKGEASFSGKSAEDRLQTAIITLDKVLSKVDLISENVSQAKSRIEQIDPNRYPKKIGKIEVRSTIANLKEQIDGISSLFVDAKPLLKNMPEIFGSDKEKTYLILFQNDKELRATGGFLTSYALFRVEKGKIRVERSEDIYSLDDSILQHPTAPAEILTYHKDVSQFYIRDSNLSPDLVESIKLFNSLYNTSTKKVNYDGIITIDSKVLVDMLRIFGDTQVDGITFSSEIDKRCDCPQVLYTLFDLVDRPVNYIKTNRKGILGDLMYALFYKAIGFSPSKYWGTLTQEMFKDLNEKHILLYFKDPEIQNAVEKMNYAGRVRDYTSDYLYINDVNFAGAKSNMFVSHTITSSTKTNSQGELVRDLTIRYDNPYPHSDCNLERGGLCLNAPLRNWIRVYVPQGSKLLNFQGSTKKVNTYDELGKTVFEGFLTVPTQGFSEVKVSYVLPETIKKDNYQLLMQKQPGTDGYKLKVNVEGRKLFDGILNEDKIIKGK